MDYLPVFLDVTEKKILIVGGGKVAAFKLKVLLPFTRNITVIAPDILPEIQSTGIPILLQKYSPSILEAFSLVYACTSDSALNRAIREDAAMLRIPVNVVDDPQFCDFISPAVYKGENFCVAVSTFGNAPGAAAKIRNEIKSALPETKIADLVRSEKLKRPKNRM